ncbi:unnamed protein product [Adineta steineri]|uniref:GRIP domain-containing protein n=3 Tax=Adineta steineri TaxID=433720 RepID=A0A815JL55_9BILA|nr:unnamed protein product [Adineta steineri]
MKPGSTTSSPLLLAGTNTTTTITTTSTSPLSLPTTSTTATTPLPTTTPSKPTSSTKTTPTPKTTTTTTTPLPRTTKTKTTPPPKTTKTKTKPPPKATTTITTLLLTTTTTKTTSPPTTTITPLPLTKITKTTRTATKATVNITIITTTIPIEQTTTTSTIITTTSTTTPPPPPTSITTSTTTTTTSTSATTTIKESNFNKWKQDAITVAGGNEKGQELNQLDDPEGIFIDKNKNIFIADSGNHRIVEWKYNATKGQIMAGGNKQGNRMDQLNNPTDVIVDQQTHSIIIADHGNKRVIQWLNQTQQILINNIGCYGLAIDKHGFLYVSDYTKNEVRRWKMGEYNDGIIVAGGNSEGDQLNQFNSPTFIFVDEDQSVYVADWMNHRVMKWRKDAKEGTVVAGENSQGENLNQLSFPQGVVVDHLGQIYVADSGNNRIMGWCEGKEEGEIVVGENGGGSQSNQLYGPSGLSFDDEGNLYVADYSNHRIQKFDTSSTKEIDDLRNQIDQLREKLVNSQSLYNSETDRHTQVVEKLESCLTAIREQHRQETEQILTKKRGELNELECELEKQRERTVRLLNEKDRELETLRKQLDNSPIIDKQVSHTSSISDLKETNEPTTIMTELFPQHLSTSTNGGPISPLNSDYNYLVYFNEKQQLLEQELSALKKERREFDSTIRELQQKYSYEISQLQVSNEQLTEDLEHIKLSTQRNENLTKNEHNIDYIKNVFYHYLLSNDTQVKHTMANALMTILHFSSKEKAKIENQKPNNSLATGGGWFNTK